jgi:D-tyrosyl-tRNA(Tyr) deacylase
MVTRGGFWGADPPARARPSVVVLVPGAGAPHAEVATGRFGAPMRVALVNEGPVTFWLETP